MFWQGIDPIAAIRVLGDAIFHVHAKDTQIYDAQSPADRRARYQALHRRAQPRLDLPHLRLRPRRRVVEEVRLHAAHVSATITFYPLSTKIACSQPRKGSESPSHFFRRLSLENRRPRHGGLELQEIRRSALTLAFGSMKATVEALRAEGLRNKVRVMVGGGPVDGNVCKFAGADDWGADAQHAVRLAKSWLAHAPA